MNTQNVDNERNLSDQKFEKVAKNGWEDIDINSEYSLPKFNSNFFSPVSFVDMSNAHRMLSGWNLASTGYGTVLDSNGPISVNSNDTHLNPKAAQRLKRNTNMKLKDSTVNSKYHNTTTNKDNNGFAIDEEYYVGPTRSRDKDHWKQSSQREVLKSLVFDELYVYRFFSVNVLFIVVYCCLFCTLCLFCFC